MFRRTITTAVAIASFATPALAQPVMTPANTSHAGEHIRTKCAHGRKTCPHRLGTVHAPAMRNLLSNPAAEHIR